MGDLGLVLEDDAVIRVGPVTIGRRPPVLPTTPGELPAAFRSSADQLLNAEFPPIVDAAAGSVIASAGTREYRTGTYYWVESQQAQATDAIAEVERHVNGALAAALSITLGDEIRAEPRCACQPPPHARAEGIRHDLFETRQMRLLLRTYRPEASLTTGTFELLRSHQVLRSATQYLVRARRLVEAAIEYPEVSEAALVEYVRVMEQVCQPPILLLDGSEEAEKQKDAALRQLLERLQRRTRTKKRVDAVKDAARRIGAIESASFRAKLRLFATQQDLGTDWLRSAQELLDVRNHHVAHKGEPLSEKERELVLVGDSGSAADSVAVTALGAAVHHLATTGP